MGGRRTRASLWGGLVWLTVSCGGAAADGAPHVGGAGGRVNMSGSGRTLPPGLAEPRVMIVGDSVSAGPGCYKKYLAQRLEALHSMRLKFVGEYADDCGSNVRHSAVSCSTAEQYTRAAFTMPNCSQGRAFPGLSTLMTRHRPDIVMLQLGVNDVWGGKTTEQTLGNYRVLVEQARAYNPRIVVLIAQIQRIRPGCGEDDTVERRAEQLVSSLPGWAELLTRSWSPIYVVDLWTGSDWSRAQTTDCVHPNDAGARRMAERWFEALERVLTPGSALL